MEPIASIIEIPMPELNHVTGLWEEWPVFPLDFPLRQGAGQTHRMLNASNTKIIA